jgi:hypothetical protein
MSNAFRVKETLAAAYSQPSDATASPRMRRCLSGLRRRWRTRRLSTLRGRVWWLPNGCGGCESGWDGVAHCLRRSRLGKLLP